MNSRSGQFLKSFGSKRLAALAIALCMLSIAVPASSFAIDDSSAQLTSSSTPARVTRSTRARHSARTAAALSVPDAKCNEGRFTPVICAKDVPTTIKYRPAYASCGGRAAALLSGPYLNAFSVVLRDRENRDRWPECPRATGNYGGCSFYQCNTLGLNRCSAFKCQNILREGQGARAQKVCCFGAPGNSGVLAGASRLTIKVRDLPGSNRDPLLRIALKGFSPKKALN